MLKFELQEYPMNGGKVTIEKELFSFKYNGIHYARIAQVLLAMGAEC